MSFFFGVIYCHFLGLVPILTIYIWPVPMYTSIVTLDHCHAIPPIRVGIFGSFFIPFLGHSHDSHYFSPLFSFILINGVIHSWHFWAILMIPITFFFHSHLFIATINENEREKWRKIVMNLLLSSQSSGNFKIYLNLLNFNLPHLLPNK